MAGKVAERSVQVIIDKSAVAIEPSDTTQRGEASSSSVDFGLSVSAICNRLKATSDNMWVRGIWTGLAFFCFSTRRVG